MVTLADIVRARAQLAAYLTPTPLEAAPGLGDKVWLKLENTNKTHSFKIRGALNALLGLPAEERARGVIAASSGNHAQGLACAAALLGVRARVLMPTHTPKRKVNGVRRWGAEAVLFGANYDESEAEALRRARAQGLTYISPYNHPLIVAGAGTMGVEIAEALPEVERVLVCAGGGGLISGVGLALKSLKPTVEVIAVCAESAPAAYNALYDRALPQVWDTLAEALSGEIEQGSITLPLLKQVVDKAVLVSEAQIADAMRWLVDEQGWLVEGGGAVGVAALRGGLLAADDRATVVVVSGGNVDGETLRRVLG
ncbi:MAG: threonine/serine dehydratase [Chloroflexi bacterium]|nr:threonine/serine dehydratase [Chloroflexota bacterium]